MRKSLLQIERLAMLSPMRRTLTRGLAVALATASFSFGLTARADTKAECASAYESSQEQKGQGRLRDARKSLVTCSQSACPAFIKKDCAKWLSEVEALLPSVVFSAKAGSEEVTDVKVALGDDVLATSLDGRAVDMDPGTHTFVFESPQYGKKEVTLVVKEGQKAQAVEVQFVTKSDTGQGTSGGGGSGTTPGTLTTEDAGGRKTIGYVMAGVGAVGLGGFAFFALSGKSDQNGLACADSKTCTDSDLDPIKKKYLYADISLGVGVVSLGVATYLLLSKPSKESPVDEAKRVRFDVAPARGGGFAAVSGSF
jgi:hypothetical protein